MKEMKLKNCFVTIWLDLLFVHITQITNNGKQNSLGVGQHKVIGIGNFGVT